MSVKRLLNQVVHAYFEKQQVLYNFLQLFLCVKFYIFIFFGLFFDKITLELGYISMKISYGVTGLTFKQRYLRLDKVMTIFLTKIWFNKLYTLIPI